MKTKDQKVMPFTATYQLIDRDRGISSLRFRNLSSQIEQQEKLHQQHMMRKQSQPKKMKESEFLESYMMVLIGIAQCRCSIKYLNKKIQLSF